MFMLYYNVLPEEDKCVLEVTIQNEVKKIFKAQMFLWMCK